VILSPSLNVVFVLLYISESKQTKLVGICIIPQRYAMYNVQNYSVLYSNPNSQAICEGCHFWTCVCVMGISCPFVLFILAIVLSVLLRLTDSNYPFGDFKPFFVYLSRNRVSHLPNTKQTKPVQIQEHFWTCVCVMGIYFVFASMGCQLDWGTVPTVICCFHFIHSFHQYKYKRWRRLGMSCSIVCLFILCFLYYSQCFISSAWICNIAKQYWRISLHFPFLDNLRTWITSP
jgi:hypothetical protein